MLLLVVLLALRVFLPLSGPPGSSTPVQAVAPSPTRTTTASPSATATVSPTPTPTASPTPTPTPTGTATFVPVVVGPAVIPPPPPPPPPPADTTTPSATATPTETATATPTSTPTIAWFVMAGQSNIGPRPPTGVPRVPADDALVASVGPWPTLDVAGDTTTATNWVALGFVRAVGLPRVGLVACGEGSWITRWVPGGDRYDRCLSYARGLPVAGLLFYQGEAEANPAPLYPDGTPREPARWAEHAAETVAAFRAEFGAGLPVVVVRIAHDEVHADRTNWATVRDQQAGLALPGVAVVEAEPAVLVDGLHLDPASSAAVGERLAAAWHGLSPPP